MSPRHRILQLIILSLLTGPALAQGVELSLPRPQVEAQPGELVTLLAVLENLGSEREQIELDLQVPHDWQILVPPGSVALEAGEVRGLPLPILLPQYPTAGDYSVVVEARTSAGVVDAVLTVRVPEQRDVRVSVEQVPANVLPAPYEVEFRVSNEGNRRETVWLRASSSRGLELSAEPASLSLEAGQSALVTVQVPAIAGLERPVQHAVTLSATPEGVEEPIRSSGRTQVVAIAQPDRLAYHTFPVEVGMRVRAVVDESGDVRFLPTAAVAGRGRLTEDSDETYGFALRYGPTIGTRHFELSMSSPAGRVAFGEQLQGTNSLLPSALGFGISASVNTPLGRVGSYGLVVNERPQMGFTVGPWPLEQFALTARGAVGFDFAALGLEGGYAQNLAGLRLNASLEAAIDANSGAPALEGSVRARGDGYEVQGNVEHRADGYLDRSSSATELDLRATVDLPADIQLAARYSDDFTGGFRTTVAQGDLRGSLWSSRWSVRYRFETRSLGEASVVGNAVAAAMLFERPADLRFGGSLSWSNVSHSGDSPGSSGIGFRAVLSTPLLGGQFLAGLSTVYDIPGASLATTAVSARWGGPIAASTSGDIRSSVNLIGNPGVRLDLGINHMLGNGTEIEGDLGFRMTGAEFDVTGAFDVSVPVELRLAAREGVSAVSGRLHDQFGFGIAPVVVHLAGYSTLTGPDGSFRFPAIPEGNHLLFVQGLPPGLITSPGLPLSIDAPVTEPLDISVVPGSSLRGTVSVAEPDEESVAFGVVEGESTTVRARHSGVRIVAESGSDRRTALTREDGTFELNGLPPGIWTVRVDTGTIPPGYSVDPVREVELQPGGTVEVSLEIRPVQREIRFTDDECPPGAQECEPAAPLRQQNGN